MNCNRTNISLTLCGSLVALTLNITTSVHKTYSTYRYTTYRLWRYQLDLTNTNVATKQFCNNNIIRLQQRFPNFFQVGTTFISQNVLRTALLLSPLKANCLKILNYSVWYAIHVNFIFSVFFGLMFNLRGPQGQNPWTTCGPRTTVWETLP
jgi:hypothetical protein